MFGRPPSAPDAQVPVKGELADDEADGAGAGAAEPEPTDAFTSEGAVGSSELDLLWKLQPVTRAEARRIARQEICFFI